MDFTLTSHNDNDNDSNIFDFVTKLNIFSWIRTQPKMGQNQFDKQIWVFAIDLLNLKKTTVIIKIDCQPRVIGHNRKRRK